MNDAFKKRLLIIELNEFSIDLFRMGMQEISLPNIAKIMEMQHTTTTTDDAFEHRGLDPWVQWVSVHLGVPHSHHKILHLADVPSKLKHPQIWEELSERGLTSGIWGAMNASRMSAKNNLFFLPDPWTFDEQAYPDKLNNLLSLPRYYAKNYLDISYKEFGISLLKLLKFLLSSGCLYSLLKNSPQLGGRILRGGINDAFLFSAFDLFSVSLFINYKKKYDPNLSIIFMNSIAHLQHHKWTIKDGGLSSDLKFGLRIIDQCLAMLFASMNENENLLVLNALSQRNITKESPRICYRQINPYLFLKSIDLKFENVEQLMTNDAHVFFQLKADKDKAFKILSEAEVGGKKLFDVQSDGNNNLKLFFQIDFWDPIDENKSVLIAGKLHPFKAFFSPIVARTGSHVQGGDIFSRGINISGDIKNHEVFKVINDYFVD
jgi:hypothetical protein